MKYEMKIKVKLYSWFFFLSLIYMYEPYIRQNEEEVKCEIGLNVILFFKKLLLYKLICMVFSVSIVTNIHHIFF